MCTVTSLPYLTGFGLLLLLGVGGCTAKEAVDPATTTCSELVTVHFCPGCTTPLTTLQLANGYYVLPIGATWQAYQA